MSSLVDKVREIWGADLPEWVEALAVECMSSSQAAVARALDRSPTVISQVLNRRYPAGLDAIEERFLGVYRERRISCPALGEMPIHECQDWRAKARAYASGNPLRVRMFQACARCPRNQPAPAARPASDPHSGAEPVSPGRGLRLISEE